MNRMPGRDDGSVIVVVAVVLPLLLLLTAGGVVGLTLFAAHRELQRAADQAALAGGSALPPLDPNVIVEHAPVPLPDTDPIYELVPADVPRIGEIVPDPRSVACAIGASALSGESAALTAAFENTDLIEPPTSEEGEPVESVCDDARIYPVVQPNPGNTTPVECANRLVAEVATDAGPLDIDAGPLDPLLSPVQATVNGLVQMPLNHVLPAAFTPRMRVDVYTWIDPPLYSLVAGRDGRSLTASATAYRRIKNAVVVPILPADQLLIRLGLRDPIGVITDPVNLNRALHTAQAPLLDALRDADERLDGLAASYGLPCTHLLHNLRQDLRDIYDPPVGAAPSALDIVDAAVEAAEAVADRTGAAQPDPDDPASLAGEAFVIVGVAVDASMRPVAATQIPILDVGLVVMREVAEGDYRAAVVSAANAYGAFRSSLVE